ncbi:MAG: hypothetical protein ACLUOI_12580 [Eisenbergiella sp.]
MKIVDLKTDNRKDNNNVGRAIPVFGWRAEGTKEISVRKATGFVMENGKS